MIYLTKYIKLKRDNSQRFDPAKSSSTPFFCFLMLRCDSSRLNLALKKNLETPVFFLFFLMYLLCYDYDYGMSLSLFFT